MNGWKALVWEEIFNFLLPAICTVHDWHTYICSINIAYRHVIIITPHHNEWILSWFHKWKMPWWVMILWLKRVNQMFQSKLKTGIDCYSRFIILLSSMYIYIIYSTKSGGMLQQKAFDGLYSHPNMKSSSMHIV